MANHSENELVIAAQRVIDEGRYDDALLLLRQAAGEQPNNPQMYYLAGFCLLNLADYTAALDAFQRTVRIEPKWPAPHLGAALALLRGGDAHGSMQILLHVLSFAPGDPETMEQLVDLLSRLRPDNYVDTLQPALEQCFAYPEIDPSPLIHLCGQQLRFAITDVFDPEEPIVPQAALDKMAETQLWCLYLSRVINTDPQLERLFTGLRRHLCLNTDLDAGNTAPTALIAALAHQCFLNEYIYPVSDDEATHLEVIQRVLGDSRSGADETALAFSLSCLYVAPDVDSLTRALAESLSSDYPWIEGLCQLTVFEPFAEAQIAETLPALHTVHHESSLAVQAQYEVNPYPRWQAPPMPPKSSLAEDFRRQFSSRPDVPQPATGTRVLVAGCGTGFEPIDIARRDDSLNITAIDLSRKSLAYAKRKAQALGCDNIDFYQGDLLDLPDSQLEFDLIVCTGVLHHMADPLAGWQVLRDQLTADGMMRISLYSRYARSLIRSARQVIESRGWTGQPDDIREFRQWLLREASHEELGALLGSDDFYSMSGCRDLLFHVQEQQFTLPQIEEALDKLGLRFCGFELADGAAIQEFSAQNPATDSLRDLEKWDIYEQENPDTFSGMYQFWCEHQ